MKNDELTLKWGTLKGYHLHSPQALTAMQAYLDIDQRSMSAMANRDSAEQTEALCKVIDVLQSDAEEPVYLSWNGVYVTREKAKEYIRNYGKE